MPDKDELKIQKKLSKTEAKAAKKSPLSNERPVIPLIDVVEDKTLAQRSADVAEKQLVLHRWKVIFAAASALIALVSLIVLLLRG
jgi:hypothetical protein